MEPKELRHWFLRNAAALPWRSLDLNATRDPYAVWISETMLQQTQVSTVKEFFIRWMNRFPNVQSLATAEEKEVFLYWQGLGYYSRARNILKTAKIVVEEWGGKFPENRKDLEALPGIGAYTAGAILSLAYHQKEAILDGNLVRIFSRLYLLDFLPTDKGEKGKEAPKDIYWKYAKDWADSPKAYLHNEALMELGRRICKVKNPLCEECPLSKECLAYRQETIQNYPPSKKHIQKNWYGTTLLVESSDEKILAVDNTVNALTPFFKNQITLPHFESQKNGTEGLTAEAERFLNPDFVSNTTIVGSYRHSITVHKIECQVLHVKLSVKASAAKVQGLPKGNLLWIKKEEATSTFAGSFSLKALEFIS